MDYDEIKFSVARYAGWKAKHRPDKCDGTTIIKCGSCGALGHSTCYGKGVGPLSLRCVDSPCCDEATPPDYPSDLNAMRSAFLSLTPEEQFAFGIKLKERTHPDLTMSGGAEWTYCMRTSARQQAEVFLEVKALLTEPTGAA